MNSVMSRWISLIVISVIIVLAISLAPMLARDTEIQEIPSIVLESRFGNTSINQYAYSEFKLSPDKTHIAVRHGEYIEVWNLSTQTQVSSIHNTLGAFTWSPDSRWIATSRDELMLTIWNPYTGQIQQIIAGIDLFSHGVRSLHWDRSNRVISGSFEYIAWDLNTGEQPNIVNCHPEGSHIWHSPDETYFATLGNSTLIWICNNNFEPVISIEGYRTLALHPQHNEIATVGFFNTLRIWDVPTGEAMITAHAGDNDILSVAWHHEGRRVTTAHSNGEVRIWERRNSNNLTHNHSAQITGIYQINWLGDKLIATGINGIEIWRINP